MSTLKMCAVKAVLLFICSQTRHCFYKKKKKQKKKKKKNKNQLD